MYYSDIYLKTNRLELELAAGTHPFKSMFMSMNTVPLAKWSSNSK